MKPRRAVAPSPIMTAMEVAEYLRISQSTLYKLISRGEIPGFKVGSDYRFRRDEIEKWIAEKERLGRRSK